LLIDAADHRGGLGAVYRRAEFGFERRNFLLQTLCFPIQSVTRRHVVCLGEKIAGLLVGFAQGGGWGAAFGTGFLTAFLSAIANNMPTVLIGALSIDASGATGAAREAMI
jgi:hypothetical protein